MGDINFVAFVLNYFSVINVYPSLGNLFQCLISFVVKNCFPFTQSEFLMLQLVPIASHPVTAPLRNIWLCLLYSLPLDN